MICKLAAQTTTSYWIQQRFKRENLQRPKDPDHSYINPCLIKEINLNQYIAENVLNWSGKCDQFRQRCFEQTNGQTDRSLKSSRGWNLCFKQLWLDQDKGDLELKLISIQGGPQRKGKPQTPMDHGGPDGESGLSPSTKDRATVSEKGEMA